MKGFLQKKREDEISPAKTDYPKNDDEIREAKVEAPEETKFDRGVHLSELDGHEKGQEDNGRAKKSHYQLASPALLLSLTKREEEADRSPCEGQKPE